MLNLMFGVVVPMPTLPLPETVNSVVVPVPVAEDEAMVNNGLVPERPEES